MDTKEIEISQNIDSKKGKSKIKYIALASLVGIVAISSVIVINISSRKGKNVVDLEDDSYLVSDEKDTYEGFNYTQEKVTLEEQGFFYNYAKNQEGSKIDVSYNKVDGLIDSSLEDKINTYLKLTAEAMYDQNNLLDSNVLYDHIRNYTDVYIFNNVLSTMYVEEFCDVEGNIQTKYSSVNINLKDLKEFDLKDVFRQDTDIKSIIPDYSEDIVFSVSPKFVYYVNSKGNIQKANLYYYKDQVAIYKRFFDNTRLFEKTFNAYPYVFTTKKFVESDVYGLQDGNVFIDTCDTLVDSNYNKEVLTAAYKLYKDGVNKAKNLAYSNPKNRYLVQLVLTIDENTLDKTYIIKVKYNAYKVQKNYFIDNIDKFMVASENKSMKEIDVISILENPPLDGQNYIDSLESDTFKIEVDESGNEITQNTNNISGIS